MKMGKKLIPGILITIMAVTMSGCNTKAPDTTEEVKVSTEAAKEEVAEPVTLTIEQESFNTAFTLEIGESKKLDVETTYEGDLEFSSDNEAIATIDEEGKVTAVKNGIVTMTVRAGDIEKHINVVVKAPVVAEEPEETTEETEDTVAAAGDTNTQSGNSGTTSGGSTSNSTTTSGNGNTTNDALASTPESITPSAPAEPATEASPGYNPEDYYLDWYYIADQVNARLKAEYPNATVGTGTYIGWDGNTYSANWMGSNNRDGYPELPWTNESMIDNIYSYIKMQLNTIGATPETCGATGMVITNIEVQGDGSRRIYYTCYY